MGRLHPETEAIVYMIFILSLCLSAIFGGGWLIQTLGVEYERPEPTPTLVVATPRPWPTVEPTPMFAPIMPTAETQWVFMGYCVPYEYLTYQGCQEYCSLYSCDIFQGPTQSPNGNIR